MLHELAFYKGGFPTMRDAVYDYDEANRLKNVDDLIQDDYDEQFQYDAQGRMTQQQRGPHLSNMQTGGDYVYYGNTNRLEKVLGAMSIDDSLHRDMSTQQNFVYDSTGNLVEDKSKGLKISYDWRGMPTEFLMETTAKNELNPAGDSSRDSVRLRMAYDGSGRRVSKTRERKTETGDWIRESVTHYTGIGTEVRESYSEGTINETKVVANMPKGLGRYGVENATAQNVASDFEWYLKNHLGSTMLVYATGVSADGSIKAAYDYRAFGEQITLSKPTEKVTENFTGKERDDETELNYFGARYLDPMIGLWTSVDPKRQFSSPYLYVGNGMNPINSFDPDGEKFVDATGERLYEVAEKNNFWNKPEIENAYKFAKTSPVEISLKRESGLIERDGMFYSGMTDPNDKEILTSATVTFSADAARAFSSEYGISFQEATARILTHEYNAHVKNFVPASVAKKAGKDAVDMEHQKNSDFEKVLFPDHEELGE